MSTIHICPLSRLEQTLATSKATWMISLSGPGKSSQRPRQITNGFLPLEFNDIAEPRQGLTPPAAEHIDRLVTFLSDWGWRSPLLINCWMGISRSTAAAAIALAAADRDQDMVVVARSLRQASQTATPNPRMIALADAALHLDGRLTHAVAAIGRGAEASEGQPFVLERPS